MENGILKHSNKSLISVSQLKMEIAGTIAQHNVILVLGIALDRNSLMDVEFLISVI